MIAEISNPLSFKFLNIFGLTIDCKNKCILDKVTELKIKVKSRTCSVNFRVNRKFPYFYL